MSSAQAAYTPSSVLKSEKVLSISLKQLKTQFCLLLGVIALSIPCNSFTAMSHMGFVIESLETPKASGEIH